MAVRKTSKLSEDPDTISGEELPKRIRHAKLRTIIGTSKIGRHREDSKILAYHFQ